MAVVVSAAAAAADGVPLTYSAVSPVGPPRPASAAAAAVATSPAPSAARCRATRVRT